MSEPQFGKLLRDRYLLHFAHGECDDIHCNCITSKLFPTGTLVVLGPSRAPLASHQYHRDAESFFDSGWYGFLSHEEFALVGPIEALAIGGNV